MLSVSSSTAATASISSSFSFIYFLLIHFYPYDIYSAEFLWGLILCFDRYYTILLIIHSQRARALSSTSPSLMVFPSEWKKKPDANFSQTSSPSYVPHHVAYSGNFMRPFAPSSIPGFRFFFALVSCRVCLYEFSIYESTFSLDFLLSHSLVAWLFFFPFASTMSHSSAHAPRILIAACAPTYTIPMPVNNLPKKIIMYKFGSNFFPNFHLRRCRFVCCAVLNVNNWTSPFIFVHMYRKPWTVVCESRVFGVKYFF